MFKKMTMAAALMTGGLVAGFAAPAMAQATVQHAPHGMRHGGGPGMNLFDGVDLTKDQKNKIRTIFQGSLADIKSNHQQLRQVDNELREAIMVEGQVDQSKIDTVLQKKAKIQEAIAKTEANIAVKVHDVLTPEQQKKAIEKLKKMQDLRRQMRDLHGKPGATH